MHGEVGEEDDEVLLHPDDEARVPLVAPGDHLHVVAHPEVFSQLVSRELQGILWANAHTNMLDVGLEEDDRQTCVCVYLQVFVFGHDGDLVAVHTEDFSL